MFGLTRGSRGGCGLGLVGTYIAGRIAGQQGKVNQEPQKEWARRA